MQGDNEDSLARLIEDVQRATAAVRHRACWYYGRQEDDGCDGCPAYGNDDLCTESVLEDVARRLHALMPHDTDGREIKVGDTIESMAGTQMRITGILPLPATILDGESLNVAAEPRLWRVMEPDSWEKLDADSQMSPSDYWRSKNPTSTRYGYEAVTGMTADLVRRAKALAGVE